MTEQITAHADPEGEAPWAMQLVARVEKTRPPAHTHLLEAAAAAAVQLLHHVDQYGTDADRAAVTRWTEGRIRKVVRRARGNAWDQALAAGTHVTVTLGAAEVAAFVPGPTDQVHPALRKLQVSGLALDDEGHELGIPFPDGRVRIYLNPEVPLTTGKAAAQVAHAAQLVYATATSPTARSWVDAGAGVTVCLPTREVWDAMTETAQVKITDAGFTEIPAGTMTCVAVHDL